MRIRWFARRDLVPCLRIDRESFREPWTAQDFHGQVKCDNVLALVITGDCDKVLGYAVMAMRGELRRVIEIERFAVDPRFRRRGICTELMASILDRLSWPRRQLAVVGVEEADLRSQLFLRSCGFACRGRPVGFESELLFTFRVHPEMCVSDEKAETA